VSSKQRFAQKHGLTFPLLADVDHKVAEAFGAWGEKSMYGKKYMGILRTTFLIGPDGRVEHVWEKVKPEGHAEEVYRRLNPAAQQADSPKPKSVAKKKASKS
jgi:peroxiredoxin Q/BCP